MSPGSLASASAWNATGSYEERHMTGWFQDRLRALVVAAPPIATPGGGSAVVEVRRRCCCRGARARARARFFLVRVTRLRLFCTQTLENFEGDADIMIVRGRARYIYEVTFKVCVLFLPAALRN
jgi:hypothetical protein